MLDISIDLETLDVIPSAHILAIGAARFDITTGEIGDCFYSVLSLKPQVNRTISPSTVGWWLQQSHEARKALTNAVPDYYINALNNLRDFVSKGDKVWGNGATFDISILENAYVYDPPWRFFDVRDMRTIVALAEEKSAAFHKDNIPFEGEKHNAIADAVHQAKVISAAFGAL